MRIKNAIQMLLVAGLIGCGGSPDDPGDETTACAVTTYDDDPVILFIPGYTGTDSTALTGLNKSTYYQSQRDFSRRDPGDINGDGVPMKQRSFIYLNNVFGTYYNTEGGPLTPILGMGTSDPGVANTIGFDSDRTHLESNAHAIAFVLTELKRCGRQATIVSHSKGGQDVLHALTQISGTLDSLDDLEGGQNNDFCGDYTNAYLDNRQYLSSEQLWGTVAGWVAFTSNHMESEFTVHNTGVAPSLSVCGLNCNLTQTSGSKPTPAGACGRYKDIFNENWVRPPDAGDSLWRFIGRLDYMHNNRNSINNMLASVTTASLYGRVNPGPLLGPKVSVEDAHNRWIRQQAKDVVFGVDFGCGIGHNDGLLPARAGQLFGAHLIEELQDEIRSADDPFGSYGYGADHLAPVISPPNSDLEMWSRAFRNKETQDYIDLVELDLIIAVAKPVRDESCYLDLPSSMLDGSKSTATGPSRGIQIYEWFENGQLIAEGAAPQNPPFAAGPHSVTLRVSAGCNGLFDEDEITFNLGACF